ncbi:MAG TPA: hypothetical protein VF261_00290 [Candidatus Saccharimonadales bacterium]
MKLKNIMPTSASGLWHFFLFWAEIFLAVRFVLHFFAVDPNGGFGAWIFHSTNALEAPFRGVFAGGNAIAGHPHYVDLQTLFVMAGYAVFTACMVWLLNWFRTTPRVKK